MREQGQVTFSFTFCAIIQNNSELKYVLVFTINDNSIHKMQHIKSTIRTHFSYCKRDSVFDCRLFCESHHFAGVHIPDCLATLPVWS